MTRILRPLLSLRTALATRRTPTCLVCRSGVPESHAKPLISTVRAVSSSSRLCQEVTAQASNSLSDHLEFSGDHDQESTQSINQSLCLLPEFITEDEEQLLLKEIERDLKRHPYEKDHWDEAIVNFRESERKHWNKCNEVVIDRLRSASFDPNCKQLPYAHVLDLAQDGYIKPHIDSVRFCGDTVAILSLLSDCVLKLVHDEQKSKSVKCLVPRRSLYILRGASRYDYTHEILRNEESFFREKAVHKSRRISIVCRNDASSHTRTNLKDTQASM